ncbi:MAG: protein kinase [Planctomycetes bacterium]|nr:protein kinase [Planctomycetota bacterium]
MSDPERLWDRAIGAAFGGAGPGRGQQLGRFVLGARVGVGATGNVFRAHDPDLGREVAVKVLRTDAPELVRRFHREAALCARLQHPGIVPVYERGAGPPPWFAMKLITGRTLLALLAERGAAEPLLAAFTHVCDALAYAHANGVVHRDLKPANIMVGEFGEVQVLDWGFAGEAGTADEAAGPVDGTAAAHSPLGLTLVGSVFGTPPYMAPEQARAELHRVDARSDVFSLGAILCEILTGAPPYVAADQAALLELARLGDLGPAIDRLVCCAGPAELVALARQCLSPGSEDRPADAAEVAAALHEYASSVAQRLTDARATLLAQLRTQRLRRLVLLLGLALLAVVVATVWGLDRMARRRVEGARVRLRRTMQEAIQQEANQRFAAALRGVERGAALLDEAAATAEMRAELATLRTRIAARQRIRGALAALESIGVDYADDPPGAERAYSQAFAEVGIPSNQSPERIARQVADLPTDDRPTLIRALDDWAAARFKARVQRSGAGDLLRVVQLADSDPWRQQLRATVIADDPAALEQIVPSGDGADTVLLARALFAAGSHERGRAVLEAARTADPSNFAVHYELATRALLAEPCELQLAESCARVAVAARANSPAPRTLLARVLRHAGRLVEASALHRQARELGTLGVWGEAQAIGTLLLHGDVAAAQRQAEALARAAPDTAFSHDVLAFLADRRGDTAAALSAARRAATLRARFTGIVRHHWILFLAGGPRAVLGVVGDEPTPGNAIEAGYSLYCLGRFAAAERVLRSASAVGVDALRARVSFELGRYAEAEEHCARARGKEDLWVDEHRFAAVCARFRRAAEELASVRGSADLRDLPPARLTLVGRLCLRVGRHADAAELLERACAERDRVVPALERELAIAAVLASRSDPAGALRLRGVARAALERALAALNARLRLGSMAAQRTVLMELCRWQWDERLAPVREGPPDWPVQEAKPWRELWGAVARTAAALRMPR